MGTSAQRPAGKPGTATAWQSCAATHTGKVRSLNEDAFLDRPDVGLWAVADGMGGHEAGDVASRMLIEALEGLEVPDSLAQAVDRIEDCIIEVNRQLFEGHGDAPGNGASGSTLTILIAARDAQRSRHIGICLWAGDSRLYRLRNGDLQQLSTDHSQVEEYIRQGRITREEAQDHPQANVITRAIGTRANVPLDADLCEMYPGDRFLLCTDGLMKHLRDVDIAEAITDTELEPACNRLVEMTLERGAGDNTTVVMIDIT